MNNPQLRLVLAILAVCLSVSPLPLSAQDKYAVVVGVETYDTSTFKNLNYATEDAVELGQALTKLGFKTTVMTSEASSSKLRPSTPEKIAAVLQTVTASCAEGDTFLVSLSGHGVQFSDEEILPSGVRETYFCPGDADLADKASLLKISSIVQFMDGAAATRKLMLIDSCREEVLSTAGQKKSARRIDLGSIHENRRSVPGGMAVLFSCSSNQFSWEHDPLRHSVFTYYVIQYLNGQAEQRFYERGEVDLDGLVFYVRKRTNDYVFRNNLTTDGQLPVLRGSSANWPLGNIAKAPVDFFVNSVGLKLKLIPAGEFLMGSSISAAEAARRFGSEEENYTDEHPQHRVRITKPFYLGTTEVTQGQWEAVMGTTPWKGEDDVKEGSDYAASYISWDEAVEFCRRLSAKDGRAYRLPTEAEWEYACRAKSASVYSFGDSPGSLKDYAWFDENAESVGEKYAHEVGQKRPNAFGLFDMHGNVWEWCSDWYGENYYATSPSSDPPGAATGMLRVLRGGSWCDSPQICRSAIHVKLSPSRRFHFFGFRVSSSVPAEPGK